jgi:hypothetical protein
MFIVCRGKKRYDDSRKNGPPIMYDSLLWYLRKHEKTARKSTSLTVLIFYSIIRLHFPNLKFVNVVRSQPGQETWCSGRLCEAFADFGLFAMLQGAV